MTVTFKNQNQVDKTIKAHLEVSAVFYTGVVLDEFKVEDFNIYTAAFQSKLTKQFQWWILQETLTQLTWMCLALGNSAVFEILPQEYMPHLGSKMSLHFIVTGKTEDENVSDVKVIFLKPPPLIVQVKPILVFSLTQWASNLNACLDRSLIQVTSQHINLS